MSHRSPKLLCSTAPFFARPLREALRHISAAGYEGVEVMVTRDPATQEPHLLSDLAGEFGLRVEAIHAPFLLITRKVWGTEPVGKIYRAIELAEDVGAPLVVIHPPYRWQAKYRRWLDERVSELSAHTGVTVAMENMFPLRLRGDRVLAFHAGQTIEDLERFPHLVLDTSHAAVAGLDILETFLRLRDRLVHVHLSNNAGKGWDSHLPVDQGTLPISDFLGLLASEGFGGTIALELDLRQYLGDETALRDVLMRNREFCEDRLLIPA